MVYLGKKRLFRAWWQGDECLLHQFFSTSPLAIIAISPLREVERGLTDHVAMDCSVGVVDARCKREVTQTATSRVGMAQQFG